MKSHVLSTPLALVSLTFALSLVGLAGCSEAQSTAPSGPNAAQGALLEDLLKRTPVAVLTPAQQAGLVQMREEEKLARDVYLHLAATHTLSVFTNIAASENTHMTAVKALLTKYGLTDPVTDDTPGVFTSPTMATLYAQLTAAGDASVLAALTVGVTIEDLDIKDLMDLSIGLAAQDILQVYGNLTRGSRNHLRSFNTSIVAAGGSYQPQYISSSLFTGIVTSPMETGRR